MYSYYSVLECYNLFSGIKLSLRSFWFIYIKEGSLDCLDYALVDLVVTGNTKSKEEYNEMI